MFCVISWGLRGAVPSDHSTPIETAAKNTVNKQKGKGLAEGFLTRVRLKRLNLLSLIKRDKKPYKRSRRCTRSGLLREFFANAFVARGNFFFGAFNVKRRPTAFFINHAPIAHG